MMARAFAYEILPSIEAVRAKSQECQGRHHRQQVAYSTFHDALTQVCFGCMAVRTSE